MTERIGIFAGTFDPVHVGHKAFAVAALQACDLSRVVFLPERHPRYKPLVSTLTQRLAGLEAMLRTEPELSVYQSASDRFTVPDTLPELLSRFGAAELTLLIGSDVCRHMADWPDIAMLCRSVSFAVGLRGTDSATEITNCMARLEGLVGRVVRYTVVTTAHAGVSSSQLRSSNRR